METMDFSTSNSDWLLIDYLMNIFFDSWKYLEFIQLNLKWKMFDQTKGVLPTINGK